MLLKQRFNAFDHLVFELNNILFSFILLLAFRKHALNACSQANLCLLIVAVCSLLKVVGQNAAFGEHILILAVTHVLLLLIFGVLFELKRSALFRTGLMPSCMFLLASIIESGLGDVLADICVGFERVRGRVEIVETA